MSKKPDDARWKEVSPRRIIGAVDAPDRKDGVTAQATSITPLPRFKLEIMYDGSFSVHKANLGVICAWMTGGDAMPNADLKVYFCPGESCDGIITPDNHGGLIAACPLCKTVWNPKQLHGEYLYVITVDKWASTVAKFVRRFNLDTDLYLKRLKTKNSLIEAEMKERERSHGGELLDAARRLEAAVYPRDRLMTDIAGGKELEPAIKAFLLA